MLHTVRQMAQTVAITLPAALLIASAPLHAQTTTLASRSDLSGPTLNWNTMYPSGTVNQAVMTPTGVPGLSVRPFGALSLSAITEGTGWSGGFTFGDPVLSANMPNGGALGLLFNMDIFAFGAQLQGTAYGPFSGRMEAWDAFGNLLGAVTMDAVSSGTNGTAPFFGLRSMTGIRLISFDVSYTNVLDASLGINQATIELAPMSAVVPEPATNALLATGLGLLAVAGRRRLRRT